MRFFLFILFIAMPFIEIALLIKLGNLLGFWPTIGLVVVTAVVGAYVLRAQGIATLHRISQSISSGEPPVKPMVDGFFLAISGAFLLTPGVITDAIGLLLLVPRVRDAIVRWGLGHIMRGGNFTVHTYTTGQRGDAGMEHEEIDGAGSAPRPDAPPRGASAHGSRKKPGQPSRDGPVIDAEFEEIKDK